MLPFLLLSFIALACAQGAGAEWWTADFIQSSGATGTGGNTGVFKFNWPMRVWSIAFGSPVVWTEVYAYNDNRGYLNTSLQTRSSFGSSCTPNCGVSLINQVMPPLAPSLTSYLSGPAIGTPCNTYSPSYPGIPVALHFVPTFTANASGLCSVTLADGRRFELKNFRWGSVTIPIPTGCVCNAKMDIWILVDHSSSISDSKMVQFKTFTQTFLNSLSISPNGINVGMSWFHYTTGVNFNITGDLNKINLAMANWWTNCSQAGTIAFCAQYPLLGGCPGCQAPATATSTAIQGYRGPTTSGNWPTGQMNVIGAQSYFYDAALGGSTRAVPKMFLTLTDGAVNHYLNQNGGVAACQFSACSPDLRNAMTALRAKHASLFSTSLTTVSMGIGQPGNDPNLSLSPEHLLILAEGIQSNTFSSPSFDLLSSYLNTLLLLSCPAGNDIVQDTCLRTCCGLCVCGSCRAPNYCYDNNRCTDQQLGACCNAVPSDPAVVCPTANKCNISSCDPNQVGITGPGKCSYTSVDCSSFTNGCTHYNCNPATGQCTLADISRCPPTDCTWGPWSSWSSCSRTCGNGTITRTRVVNQTATNGGAPCLGSSSENLVCVQPCCPVNCAWSGWSAYSPACTQCGVGNQTRTRTITTAAVCGGAACVGNASQTINCPACINRNCSGYNSTGSCVCHPTGANGTTIITFTINVAQSGNGLNCTWPSGTRWNVSCTPTQINACPKPCQQEWTAWSPCDCFRNIQNRSYFVYRQPLNGGTACAFRNNFSELQSCTPSPSQNCPEYGPLCTTDADCNDGLACIVDRCLIAGDGQKHCFWNTTLSCPPNHCLNSNVCDNSIGCVNTTKPLATACPTPSKCNISRCVPSLNNGNGGCSYTQVDCSGFSVGCQNYTCNPTTGSCTVPDRSRCPPINCTWSDWTSWTNCPVTCGTGSSIRTRVINQSAMDGGVACTGPSRETLSCNTQCCPVNCAVNGWSQWSACPPCITANRTRTRTIRTNPSCNGTDCSGFPLNETSVCPPCTPQNCVGVNITGTCFCSPDGFSGTTITTFSVTQPAVGNGTNCTDPDGTQYNVSCTPSQINNCPKPCIENWSNWTECNCYNASQSRSYTILQNASNGGTPCAYKNSFVTIQSCTPTFNCTDVGPPCLIKEECNDELACTIDKCLWDELAQATFCNWKEVLNCTSNNICESQYCDNTVGCRKTPIQSSIACPTTNLCNLSSCDPTLNGGLGACVFTQVNCSAFSDGCQRYLCDGTTGKCTVPDRSLCPPIPCTYGEWGAWTTCQVSCGNGTQTRTRGINQTAQDGGANCTGPTDDNQTCNAGCCPADCVVTDWSAWDASNCTLCSTNNQTRTRTIVSIESCGGIPCPGLVENTLPCPPCAPVDCIGGNVTGPCNCSASGEEGTHIVTYVITRSAVGTGQQCPFPEGRTWTENCTPAEFSMCPHPCLEVFSNFSVCDCFNNTHNRTYTIIRNATNGGTPCSFNGNFTDVQSCTPDPSQNCFGPSCVTPADCNDGLPCTVDKCILLTPPGTYHCDWSETTYCNDSNVCTSDKCDPATGCTFSQSLFCEDSNACTIDSCDNVTGCVYAAVFCPDADLCNLGSCDQILGCGTVQRSCNMTGYNNCTTAYCDRNFTGNLSLSGPCVYVTDSCGSYAALAIGLSAGIIAGIICAAILAFALCSGGAYAASTQMGHFNEHAVQLNPLYQGSGYDANNPLFSGDDCEGV